MGKNKSTDQLDLVWYYCTFSIFGVLFCWWNGTRNVRTPPWTLLRFIDQMIHISIDGWLKKKKNEVMDELCFLKAKITKKSTASSCSNGNIRCSSTRFMRETWHYLGFGLSVGQERAIPICQLNLIVGYSPAWQLLILIITALRPNTQPYCIIMCYVVLLKAESVWLFCPGVWNY